MHQAKIQRVFLVDDHPIYRLGVAGVLAGLAGVEVCGQAGSAVEARVLVERLQPDLVLLDLMLGGGDGLTLIRELRQLHAGARIVVVTMLDRAEFEGRALAAGACGFVTKAGGDTELTEAVRGALQSARSTHPGALAESSVMSLLTDRELQVFQMLGLGRSSREIAHGLGISPRTVDAHRENIKAKLGEAGARSLAFRAALWVREQGLTA